MTTDESRDRSALLTSASTTKADLYALLSIPTAFTPSTATSSTTPPDAPTPHSISKAWRRAALTHHPDKNPGNEAAAAEKLDACRQAYEILKDDEARAVYDARRRAEEGKKVDRERMEGRRRKMAEDLVARESAGTAGSVFLGGAFPGGMGAGAGVKRRADESEQEREIKRLAAESRRRRAERDERARRETREDKEKETRDRQNEEDLQAARARMRSRGVGKISGKESEANVEPPPKRFSFAPKAGGSAASAVLPGGAKFEATMARLREMQRKKDEAARSAAGSESVKAEG